jgi:predicted ATPase
MKVSAYFAYTRTRPDRQRIKDEWIQRAIDNPVREQTQSDGRVRRWTYVTEEDRYLRVVLLADRETVHNAFFDRRSAGAEGDT